MYNRYIPQPDGTYRKNRVHDAAPIPTPPSKPPVCPEPEPAPPFPPPKPSHSCSGCRHSNKESIPGFLKQLLPKNMDTGDLMIILLLLLMAGDCEESRNNALLTLAIYFFL